MSSVERLFEDLRALKQLLLQANELSLLTAADNIARKTLLIAAASFFEESVIACIVDYYRDKANGDEKAVRFVQKKGLERQYHALFDWKKPNANRFFAFFGEEFLSHMKQIIENDRDLQNSIEAFMEIGRERNRLVHGNYSQYALDKSPEEVFDLYNRAKMFLQKLPTYLRSR
jgi:hypothetical protein